MKIWVWKTCLIMFFYLTTFAETLDKFTNSLQCLLSPRPQSCTSLAFALSSLCYFLPSLSLVYFPSTHWHRCVPTFNARFFGFFFLNIDHFTYEDCFPLKSLSFINTGFSYGGKNKTFVFIIIASWHMCTALSADRHCWSKNERLSLMERHAVFDVSLRSAFKITQSLVFHVWTSRQVYDCIVTHAYFPS